MDHSQIVPHFCGYPQSGLWKGVLPSSSECYGLFLNLVSYALLLGFTVYSWSWYLFEIRTGPQMETKELLKWRQMGCILPFNMILQTTLGEKQEMDASHYGAQLLASTSPSGGRLVSISVFERFYIQTELIAWISLCMQKGDIYEWFTKCDSVSEAINLYPWRVEDYSSAFVSQLVFSIYQESKEAVSNGRKI